MKNLGIAIRDRFNAQISDLVKEQIKNLEFSDINDFYMDENYRCEFYKKCFKVKYIFGFEDEDSSFLEEVKESIERLNLHKLIDLCDGYEFRFFKVFDYLMDCRVINNKNFKDIYSIFLELIKLGTTLNSLNLSVFILNIFDKKVMYDFCKKILCKELDHMEMSAFICRHDNFESGNLYFNLFRDSYRKFDIKFLYKFNEFERYNSRSFIISFYIFSINDINFATFDFIDLKVLVRYTLNLKKSIDRLGNKFLLENRTEDFKNILNDLNLNLGILRSIVDERELIHNCYDIEFIYFCIVLFEDVKLIYLNNGISDFLLQKLIYFIECRDFKNVRTLVDVYNELDFDVSAKLSRLFIKNYFSSDFCEYIFRVFRNYRYFGSIVNCVESNFYLTKVLEKFEFRVCLLRSLTLYYSRYNSDLVGINFLKNFMGYIDFYNENSSYVNFIAQKLLERNEG